MAAMQLQSVVQGLRRATLVRDGGPLSDGELLESFIADNDEAAFAALVRRHGPMVLGVCRRVLRNPEDAEDAFQATFLVLVRKAATIHPPEKVGNWLYGVARTTAIRANSLAARRRRWEKQVRELPDAEAPPDNGSVSRDLRLLLDNELAKLPEKYRTPIVLCDLESRTVKQAAQMLDWPQGTVAGRLARGRKLLADRLTRSGVAVSAGTIAAIIAANSASAQLPTTLAASMRVARLCLAQTAADSSSVKAIALMKGVVKTMFWNKLKTAVLAFGVVGVGIYAATFCMRTAAAEPPPSVAPPAATADAHRRPDPERKEYRVEVRLMEALQRPDTFHSEREVIWFPAMVMAENEPMTVGISQGTGREASVELPSQAKPTIRLRTGVKLLSSGKMAVDITYNEDPPVGRHSNRQRSATTQHAAGEVTLGKIAELTLPRAGNGKPRQWFEVMVREWVPLSEGTMSPPRTQSYQIQFKVIEVNPDGEKVLAYPTVQVLEDHQATFSNRCYVNWEDAMFPESGLLCTATVHKLPDGRLRLDMRIAQRELKLQKKDELRIQDNGLHVRKDIRPERKVNVEFDGVGKQGHRTRVEIVVTPVKD